MSDHHETGFLVSTHCSGSVMCVFCSESSTEAKGSTEEVRELQSQHQNRRPEERGGLYVHPRIHISHMLAPVTLHAGNSFSLKLNNM